MRYGYCFCYKSQINTFSTLSTPSYLELAACWSFAYSLNLMEHVQNWAFAINFQTQCRLFWAGEKKQHRNMWRSVLNNYINAAQAFIGLPFQTVESTVPLNEAETVELAQNLVLGDVAQHGWVGRIWARKKKRLDIISPTTPINMPSYIKLRWTEIHNDIQ